MTNAVENESWRVAGRAVDLLSVDRDISRRAFYQEPKERIYEIIKGVLSERNLPGHDPKRMIERWGPQARRASTAGPSTVVFQELSSLQGTLQNICVFIWVMHALSIKPTF